MRLALDPSAFDSLHYVTHSPVWTYVDGTRSDVQDTRDGVPLWSIRAMAVSTAREDGFTPAPEEIRFKVASRTAPDFKPFAPLTVTGLAAITYTTNSGGLGIAFRADSVDYADPIESLIA